MGFIVGTSNDAPASELAKMMWIVHDLEKKLGYSISSKELRDVVSYTVRKNSVLGMGNSYLPILFETELRDHVMRKAINEVGRLNHV